MTISTRARVAFLVAVVTLLIAGFAGGPQLAAAGSEDGGGGSKPQVHGGVAGACAAPEPGVEADADCNDTVGAPIVDPGTCGEQTTGAGPDAAVSYTPCPGDEPAAPSDPYDGAQTVEPRPGMANVHPLGFDKAVVSDDDTSVTIFFWSGVEPCYVLDHVDVEYGGEAITITLLEGHDPSAGDVACIEIAMLKKTVVQLDQPVGDRVIVDGAA
jgi:hypothetical protein